MKGLLRLGFAGALALTGSTLLSATPTCQVSAIVAADTGNIIGYVVRVGGSSMIVQNANSIATACQKLAQKQPKEDKYEV